MGKLFRSVFKIMIGAGLFMAGWYAREFFADDSEYDFDDDWQGGDPYGKCGDCDDFFDEDGFDCDEGELDGRDETQEPEVKRGKCHNCHNCTCDHTEDIDE